MFKIPALSLYDKAILIGVVLALFGLSVMSRLRSDQNLHLLMRTRPASQNWLSGNQAVSVREFMAAYSSGVPQEKYLASVYLLGVLDSTEGVVWCDYKKVSPEVIVGEIDRALQNWSRADPDVRLSSAVAKLLAARHPCSSL